MTGLSGRGQENLRQTKRLLGTHPESIRVFGNGILVEPGLPLAELGQVLCYLELRSASGRHTAWVLTEDLQTPSRDVTPPSHWRGEGVKAEQ